LKLPEPNTLLTTSPPAFSLEQAREIALLQFGYRATAMPLVSERDQNFRLQTEDGQKFVLKIANTHEDPQVIDFQTRALEHIAIQAPGLPVPRNLLTVEGGENCTVRDSNGNAHIARLISWLDGIPVGHIQITPALLRDMGATLARTGKALSGFTHPAAEHKLLWDLKNAAGLIDLLPYMQDVKFRLLLEKILFRFRDHVQPRLQGVRTQIVHCDLNTDNVLADPENHSRVSGVIDFGDMVHTQLVNDLAIAAAYHLSASDNPLAASLEIIGGYHAVTPLHSSEIELLFDLMLTRLVTSVTISNFRAQQFPENAAYLLNDFEFAKNTLEHLSSFSEREVLQRIQVVCS